MLLQWILNLNNPQNQRKDKEDDLNFFIGDMVENFSQFEKDLRNIPEEYKSIVEKSIFYKKILKTLESSSSIEQKCKTLFILNALMISEGIPSITNFNNAKISFFKGINIECIYHTGYDIDSVNPRPVFTIGPNIMSWISEKEFILPISHNFAIRFSINNNIWKNRIIIFSANPDVLKCKTSSITKIYKVSHDYIDNKCNLINQYNLDSSGCFYSPHSLADITEYYSEIQPKNLDYYNSPTDPLEIIK